MALIGYAMRRKRRQQHARLAQEKPAHYSDQQVLEPGQFNDHTIPEVPEETLEPDTKVHSWHQRLWQGAQAIFFISKWKQGLSKSRLENQLTVSNLNEAEKGNSPKKLQKQKGTRPENPNNLPVPIIPPASAMPSYCSDGGLSNKAVPRNHDTSHKAQNRRANAVEGSTTARQIRSKGAATRRSSRSSSA
ncbi:MAG: hypothetical protein Q9225_007436 [Loekoesia sp. 1 TL-2023]